MIIKTLNDKSDLETAFLDIGTTRKIGHPKKMERKLILLLKNVFNATNEIEHLEIKKT